MEVFLAHARGSSAAELLSTVRANPASVVSDAAKEVRAFRVATTGALGAKRGRGRGSFIDSVLTPIDGFYADVLGSLRTWSAAPPKLRPEHAEPPQVDDTVPIALTSTDYSSQDGSEPSGAGQEDPDPLSSLEVTAAP